MDTPLHARDEAGLRPARSSSTSIAPEGDTTHYGGPSPWGSSVDRASPARFRDSCDHDRCASIWRAWQAYHMDDNGWSDIAYTSGVCPHGHRYEGRGHDVRTAAQGTSDGNRRSYATVYIAGAGDPLTEEAKAAFLDETSRLGVRLRWDHSDWKPTSCAGNPIRSWKVAGWPAPDTADIPTGPAGPGPQLPPAPVTGSRRLLRRGVRGRDVREWQRLLTGAGHSIAVDGIFGPETEQATRTFQAELDVAADGVVGPETRRATGRLLRWVAAAEGSDESIESADRPYPGQVSMGDRGRAVRGWQEALVDRGYRIQVDGVFGPATNHVIVDWQRKHGLEPDGVGGPNTWHSLLYA